MPMPCFLSITGKNQGKIEGSCAIDGHAGTILVQAEISHVKIPRNPQTGLPAGKRVHEPFLITKEIDKASPKILQALTTGEQLTEVLLEYFRISSAGKEELYYTIKLENAIVVSLEKWFPNCLDKAKQSYGHMEDVSFSYEKVTWSFTPDGIEADDSWLAPK
jgi:type VI secretion system secreted protein Hcp